MPEINNLEDREGDPAKTPVADGPDDRQPKTQASPDTAQALPFETPTAPPELGIIPARLDEDEGIPNDDFAANVILGLEQAGLDFDHEFAAAPSLAEKSPGRTGSGEDIAPSEMFFSGWGGEQDLLPEMVTGAGEPLGSFSPFPKAVEVSAPPKQSFPSLSDAKWQESTDQEADVEVSVKHDALAEAVQSALLSVYGMPAPAGGDVIAHAGTSGLGFKSYRNEEAESQFQPNPEGTSPQDIILNYFNYEASGAPRNRVDADSQMEDLRGAEPGLFKTLSSEQTPAAFVARGRDEGFPGVVSRSASSADLGSSARYDGPASFPLPVPSQPAPVRRAQTPRESGRLLGAAGVGLIGGIAIAASLAVFTINSYGPQTPKLTGDPRQDSERGSENYGTGVDTASAPSLPGLSLSSSGAKPAVSQAPAEVRSEVIAADIAAPAGQPAPLSIAVKSPRPLEQTLVSITGVPQGSRLNAGVDAGAGNWLLPPRRLTGLTLTLPADARETYSLEVELLDTSRAPLSDKRRFVVRSEPGSQAIASAQPAATQVEPARPAQNAPGGSVGFNTQIVQTPKLPEIVVPPFAPLSTGTFNTQTVPSQPVTPPVPMVATNSQLVSVSPAFAAPELSAQPQSAAPTLQLNRPIPQLEIEDLIREGNKKMREGDIVKARELYLKAVNLGDADASLAMGRSFDPIYFERLEKKNAEADPAKAFDWYKKAMDGGAVQTAKVRIENLKQHLNR